jgi:hypothetical protein
MPDIAVVAERNLDGYGAPMISWTRIREVLASTLPQAPDTGGPNRHTAWLATTAVDGTPHVRPVGVMSLDDTWYFSSGPDTRKTRNLVRDPRCVLNIATHPFDVVIAGRAERVTESAELQGFAEAAALGGWPARVEGDAVTAEFNAPSAGPPPWHVYRIIPRTVHAFGTAEPFGAARFDLTSTGVER